MDNAVPEEEEDRDHEDAVEELPQLDDVEPPDFPLGRRQSLVDEGKHTGAKPGKVLRGPGYRP